ncbi:MAG: DUF177 domain-containing protein [Syntrophomonadaceae bacterium]|nr:DUF177 domain-containing protein [Syntrophomonadaceae bacterium]
MKIDLKWLKMHPQENKKFHLEAIGEDELLKELGGRFIAPVKVELLMSNNHRVLAGQGRVQTLLELTCSRCLTELQFPVNSEFSMNLVDIAYRDEFMADEDEIILADQDILDIKPWVEAAIFINLPLNPLCNADCKGICSGCGVNRNLAECRCKEEEIDPRWTKLKNLS